MLLTSPKYSRLYLVIKFDGTFRFFSRLDKFGAHSMLSIEGGEPTAVLSFSQLAVVANVVVVLLLAGESDSFVLPFYTWAIHEFCACEQPLRLKKILLFIPESAADLKLTCEYSQA